MASITTCSWHTLPAEMKLAIVDILPTNDVLSFSKVDLRTYEICVPATFKSVKLNNYNAVEGFLDHVPRSYFHHIQQLDLCTKPDNDMLHTVPSNTRSVTDAVVSIIIACPRLQQLSLRLNGSLGKSIITPFPFLSDLKCLAITNCGDEVQSPLSERLVVAIAASVPSLQELSLDRVSRSMMHAPELEGVYPHVPLVLNDNDIPEHPVLGSELSLPSLLCIATLRKLIIRDTHLGDPRWATTPVACRLEVLDLGSCYHETEEYNRICTERIMSAVGPTIDEFALTTSVSDGVFAEPSVTPLRRLRKLHISPFFPVDNVVDTMSNLAGSPIESLSMQCFEDDVVDVCSALEEFLSLRVERSPDFYDKLTRITVSIAASDDSPSDPDDQAERFEATNRLQEFCQDLNLTSNVATTTAVSVGNSRAGCVSPSHDKCLGMVMNACRAPIII